MVVLVRIIEQQQLKYLALFVYLSGNVFLFLNSIGTDSLHSFPPAVSQCSQESWPETHGLALPGVDPLSSGHGQDYLAMEKLIVVAE